MAREIERKFLVRGRGWTRTIQRSIRMTQGYLAGDSRCSVRVRRTGEESFLNLKSATIGVSRLEFDYPLPTADADAILEHLCTGPPIEKIRHYVPQGRHTWEIDEFKGANEGLVVAEIELSAPDERFERPNWLGEEVSDDPRYYNVRLAVCPYTQWNGD